MTGKVYIARNGAAMTVEQNYTILLMEDDPNDVLLIKRALRKNKLDNPVQVVPDGSEGVKYLKGEGKYADRTAYPFPRVVIMDLKMPRMGGIEVLEWLKKHPEYLVIPTLVLTSSKEQLDIKRAYQLGCNSFLVKPSNFDELQDMLKKVHQYWEVCVKPETLDRE